MSLYRTPGEAPDMSNDPLAALRARIALAKAVKIELTEEQKEKAALLEELSKEAARAKSEQDAANLFKMREAMFDVRMRLPDTLLDSTIIDGVGPVIVRAPNGGEGRALKDATRKGQNAADAAEQTFALAITEYPDREVLKVAFTNYPFMVTTIVDMGMKLGGLQQESERKSR